MAETPKPPPPRQDARIELLALDRAYEGFFRIDRYRLKHRRFDGGWTPELDREIFERGQAVALLPYDPRRDEVVLIEQFRVGAYAAGVDPWLLEIVAGIIEPGETPERVARRETEEEAGLTVGRVEQLAEVFVSPGGATERVTIFCGEVDSSGAGGLHGLPSEGEDIRVLVRAFSEIPAALAAGAFTNAPVLIALQWLAANRDRLRQAWTS
ncbi:MAG TPA: NUDIX domain-containing protein [Kiloniellaceae bacterium]|nr:NUDIX domain-containing protein [Kiloniellaceae bacterium]